MRCIALRALALLVGCPTAGDDDDTSSDDWTLEVVNDSGISVDLVQQRSCPSTDEDDWSELALPPGGIEPGATQRWLLPTPGCFALGAEGGGCYASSETDPLQLGDQFTWTLLDEDLMCVGG